MATNPTRYPAVVPNMTAVKKSMIALAISTEWSPVMAEFMAPKMPVPLKQNRMIMLISTSSCLSSRLRGSLDSRP